MSMVYGTFLTPDSQPFRRNLQPVRPFHVSVYRTNNLESHKPQTRTQPPSFPEAENRVTIWIPGVSTPEGIVLLTGFATLLVGGEDLILKMAQTVAASIVFAVAAGVPTTAIWLATNITK